ncbi:DNA-binding protein SMUBP-2 (ATP-dependent helicase IGHMBP2) (Antifreeze enhancer-binding protein ortholog) (AEP) [Durusdinium trenchii]|uniref:DNA-binding protein SMUBP-2 (ATP-dependent helicase IGHMBP2) (Antifreeze enhancer-binding protein ortholog) (AEP) n=1 Tax=Durusdinium trenchii TaxID=1381693 RepID=A0ABP0MQN0_9DINO
MTTESFRKDVAKKLSELQSSTDEEAKIDFPSDLTSSDRKYIHKIAESFRLHTLSSGTGDARFISVYKNPPAGQEAKRPREPPGATPPLSLSSAATQNLQQIVHSSVKGPGRDWTWIRQRHNHVILDAPSQDIYRDCLIRGLQAHIRFLQDCLLEPDSRVQQVEEQLETERRRSWELEKSLERKALICEDLVARQQLETKLAAPIEEKGPRRSSTWDDSTTEGTSTARSNCTEEDEEVIEAFISQLAPTRPPLPASSGPPSRPRETSLARRARRQQERCRTLSQDVCALAALHQAAWSRPEALTPRAGRDRPKVMER